MSPAIQLLLASGERWRYPSLLAAAARSPDLDAPTATALLARDVAESYTPTRAIRALIGEGEFAAARQLLDQGDLGVDKAERDELRTALTRATTDAIERLNRRVTSLNDRARRVDAEGVRTDGLSDLVRERASGADQALVQAEERIATAEAAARDQIEAGIEQLEREHPGDGRITSARAALEADEYRLAKEAVRSDAQGIERRDGPGAVPRPPEWRWSFPMADMLTWLEQPDDPGGPPEFRSRCRDLATDKGAAEMVAMIRRLESAAEVSLDDARDLAAVMDRLLGLDDSTLDHPVEPCQRGDGAPLGYLTEFYGLSDPRLAGLRLFSEGGARLFIPTRQPQPSDGIADLPGQPRGPILWAATSLTPRSKWTGWVRLDTLMLLRLALSPPPRGVNLLRLICPQLRLEELLPHRFEGLETSDRTAVRQHLAWVFDLLGVETPTVAIDALLLDTAAQPELIWLLLRELLPAPGSYPAKLHVDHVEGARTRESFKRAAEAYLIREISDDPVAMAALAIAVTFFSNAPFHAKELNWDGATDETEMQRALERLHRAGLVKPDGTMGRYVLPSSEVTQLLLATRFSDPDKFLNELHQHLAAMLQQRQLVLGDQMNQVLVHKLVHQTAALNEALRAADERLRGSDRATATDLDQAKQLGEEAAKTLEEHREQSSLGWRATNIRVADVVDDVRRGVTSLHEMIQFIDDGIDGDAEAAVNLWVLKAVIWNLVTNAVEAMERDRGRGRLWVRVRLAPAEPAGPKDVWIVVEDSGPGIPPEHRDRIWEQGFSTKHEKGRGLGLYQARLLAQQYGGGVELTTTSDPTRGACFRIRLPKPPGPAVMPTAAAGSTAS